MFICRLFRGAGWRQGCHWGMNHLEVSSCSPSLLLLTLSETTCSPNPNCKPNPLNPSYISHISHSPTPKFPSWRCWAWAAGGEPRGAAAAAQVEISPSKALNSVLQLQTWAWHWPSPQWWQRWVATVPSPASGFWTSSGFLAFGWFLSDP